MKLLTQFSFCTGIVLTLLAHGQEPWPQEPLPRDAGTVGTMGADPYTSLEQGAELYILSFQDAANVGHPASWADILKLNFTVKECLAGRNLETLSLPCFYQHGRGGSRGSGPTFPEPGQVKKGQLFLCEIVPWFDDPKVEGLHGTLLHAYPVDASDAPIVLAYRKILKISQEKEHAAVLKAIDELVVDPEAVARAYCRTYLMFRISPKEALPLLIKQLNAADALKLSPAEDQNICDVIGTVVSGMGVTTDDRKLALAAYMDQMHAPNADLRQDAVQAWASLIANHRDGFEKPAPLLSDAEIIKLKKDCTAIMQSADAPKVQHDCAQIILNWLK